MKKLSREDINNLSIRIFDRYQEVTGKAIPRKMYINPVKLAQETLKLKIVYMKLSYDGDVLGLTSTTPVTVGVINNYGKPMPFELDGNTILIDSALLMTAKEGERNFTIAHEYAHQILNRMYPDEDEMAQYILRDQNVEMSVDWKEWQANTLASCLVMPEFLIKKYIKADNTVPAYLLTETSKKLHVSKSALKVRLTQLGYRVGDEIIDVYNEGST